MASGGLTFSNAFALLDEDGPPAAAPAKKEKQKAAPAPTPAPVEQKRERGERTERSERPSSGRGGRGGGGRGRTDDRRRGAPQREGKRDYDRHESGTGRDKSTKRSGSGKYNWGSNDDEAKDGERRRRNKDTSEKTEKEGEEGEAAPEREPREPREPRAKKEEPEKEPEEPDNSVSYEDYLANKKALDEDVNRKERVADNDDSNWKSAGVVKNEVDESDTYVIPGGAKSLKKKGGKKKKGVISLDEFAAKPAAGRGRGGARGRGGERGRGGGRGRGPRGGNVDLSDASAFPTLGGK